MSNYIVQLLISMIIEYDNYGDSIGYNKLELEGLIQEYQLFQKGKWNELGSIVLYELGYISKDRFCKELDLELDDGDFWIIFDNFEDVLPKDFEFEAKFLDGNIWEDWQPSDYYDYDFSISDFNDNVLKEIVNYCIKNECSIELDDDEIITSKDNIKIKDGKIYIGSEDLDEHIDDDGMEELKREIQFGISEAHDHAEQDAFYEKIKSNFISGIGEYKYKNVDVIINNKNKNVEKLLVKVDDFDNIKRELEDTYTYNGKTTYSEEDYHFGSMYHVLNELGLIEMDKPNYDYLYSSPNSDTINDCVINRLY